MSIVVVIGVIFAIVIAGILGKLFIKALPLLGISI